MTDKKQARPRFRFHRAVFLSVGLSIASLGGSMASCAANQPSDREPVEEPAVFCYNSIGEVACYSAPQPHLGSVVALPAEPLRKKKDAPTAEESAPVQGKPVGAPPADTPAAAPTDADDRPAPTPLKPSLKPEA